MGLGMRTLVGTAILGLILAFQIDVIPVSAKVRATRLPQQVYAIYPEPFGTSNAYTGIYQVHWDAEPFGMKAGPCANSLTELTNEPVYYPQWINFNSRDFIELGIAFPCQGQRFWYGAYRDLNGFHTIFTDLIHTPPLGQENVYQMFRISEFWNFHTNEFEQPSMFWNAVGNNASLGMEVWRAEAYSQYITHHTLNKTISEQPWVPWNGVPVADSGMCSVAITPSSFKEKRPFSGTGC
jgi:hypothetical protein